MLLSSGEITPPCGTLCFPPALSMIFNGLFETRPIYHQLDETIRGHVACSFLALVLTKELEDRLAAAGDDARASWPAVVADLDSLTETEVEQDGKRFLLRSAPRPAASLTLSALGVALPPTLRQVAVA